MTSFTNAPNSYFIVIKIILYRGFMKYNYAKYKRLAGLLLQDVRDIQMTLTEKNIQFFISFIAAIAEAIIYSSDS